MPVVASLTTSESSYDGGWRRAEMRRWEWGEDSISIAAQPQFLFFPHNRTWTMPWTFCKRTLQRRD